MDSSYRLAASEESSHVSRSTVSHESFIAPATPTNPDHAYLSGSPLSARECAVVLLMCHGFTNKRIARELSITPETVKTHATRIYRKLTVQTRAEAVYRASALGLV